jgi:ABC-type glycerol-3-phosphate transport system substrate-binding protein
MTKFQIILTSFFLIFIGIGVVMFATFRNDSSNTTLPPIEVWGTLSRETFSEFLNELSILRGQDVVIDYVELSADSFNREFIETLARGGGPDAVLLPVDMTLRHEDKIIPIPYTVLTERNFRDTYVRSAELYLSPDGINAIPFYINPLVMYWNRSIITNAGIPTYPKYWDEFPTLISKINQKDAKSNIRRSAIALGEFKNITNARAILASLFFQAGNPITLRSSGQVISSIGNGAVAGSNTSIPALEFFTKFVDPRNTDYSWNRSLPASKSAFLSGTLATYFGFASEIQDLREKNPNIDFDVAPLPQARGGANRSTYAELYGFSIVRSAESPDVAYAVISSITAPDALALLGELTYLPSVRRDVISLGTTDPYISIFNDSAVIASSWLDPNPSMTNQIFTSMVESVTSGKKSSFQAVTDAHNEMERELSGI